MSLVNTIAHRYLELGWSVIPVQFRSKVPSIKAWKEYQTRLPTKQEIDEWFPEGKQSNIALLTGTISKVSVLDADGPAGLKSLADLKLGSTVQSASGRGRHLLYSDPTGKVKNFVKRYPGLDARGEGGYVVVYPSIHESGKQYKWLGNYSLALPEFPSFLLSKVIDDKIKSTFNAEELLRNVAPGNRHDTLLRLIGKFIQQKWEDDQIMTMLSPLLEKFNSQGVDKDAFIVAREIICSLREKEARNETRTTSNQSQSVDRQSRAVFSPNGNLADHRSRLLSKSNQHGPEISTGLPILDRYTWGLLRGEIFTVAARTGVGKTSFAVGLVKNLLNANKRVLLFSTEMSSELIVNRLLSSYTGLAGSNFRSGNFSDEDKKRLDSGYEWLERVGHAIKICDLSSPKIEVVKQLTQEHKPDVVVFDHIQHIGGGNDVRNTISEFTRGLKDVARDFDCSILVLSQLRRMFKDPKTGQLPPPQLSDLKESGTIEEESGQVLLLSEMSTEPGTNVCTLMGELAKNRFGECTKLGIEFDRSNATFRESTNAEMSEM